MTTLARASPIRFPARSYSWDSTLRENICVSLQLGQEGVVGRNAQTASTSGNPTGLLGLMLLCSLRAGLGNGVLPGLMGCPGGALK